MASTISAGTTSTTALVYTADTSGVLQLQTNGTTTAVTIDTSQRVGIGTTSPETKLNVSGGLATTGIVSYFENASSGANVKLHFSDATTYNWTCGTTGNNFTWSTGEYGTTAGTERMRIDSSGNLGLGVTPSSAFSSGKSIEIWYAGNAFWSNGNNDVRMSANVKYNLYASTGAATTYVQDSGVHSWSVASSGTAGNSISFTQAMLLDNNGLLSGYSTTDTFHAYNSNSAGNSHSLLAGFYNSTGIGTGTLCLNITSNGNITNTNNSYGPISDVKLKENIVDATPKLADILKLQVRNYNLKSELGYQSHKQIGFIAQELETVFPALIDEHPDRDKEGKDLGTTTKSIKTSVLVPMLVKAIQELSAQVTTLQSQVAALKA